MNSVFCFFCDLINNLVIDKNWQLYYNECKPQECATIKYACLPCGAERGIIE